MKNTEHLLINNIERLHTTDLGVYRIRKNLSLSTDDVVSWCKEKILSPQATSNPNPCQTKYT